MKKPPGPGYLQMPMGTYVDRGLSAEDKGRLKILSLELVADKALGFNFFQAPSVKHWVQAIRRRAVPFLPSARVLAGPFLAELAQVGHDTTIPQDLKPCIESRLLFELCL